MLPEDTDASKIILPISFLLITEDEGHSLSQCTDREARYHWADWLIASLRLEDIMIKRLQARVRSTPWPETTGLIFLLSIPNATQLGVLSSNQRGLSASVARRMIFLASWIQLRAFKSEWMKHGWPSLWARQFQKSILWLQFHSSTGSLSLDSRLLVYLMIAWN